MFRVRPPRGPMLVSEFAPCLSQIRSCACLQGPARLRWPDPVIGGSPDRSLCSSREVPFTGSALHGKRPSRERSPDQREACGPCPAGRAILVKRASGFKAKSSPTRGEPGATWRFQREVSLKGKVPGQGVRPRCQAKVPEASTTPPRTPRRLLRRARWLAGLRCRCTRRGFPGKRNSGGA